jgi:hypothetical protein
MSSPQNLSEHNDNGEKTVSNTIPYLYVLPYANFSASHAIKKVEEQILETNPKK